MVQCHSWVFGSQRRTPALLHLCTGSQLLQAFTRDSFSPTQYKINLVRCLTNRILRLCSQSVVQKELDTLRKILERNGYPDHVLDKWVTQDPPQRGVGSRPCPLTLSFPSAKAARRNVRKKRPFSTHTASAVAWSEN